MRTPKAIISLCSSFFFFTVAFSQQISIVYGNESNAKETIHSNNIVEEVIYKYKIQHKPDSSILMIRRYDSTGNVIESQDYNDKSLVKRTTYIYNFQNQLTKSISNSVKSNSNSIQEYVYDSLGNEINEYDYNQDTSSLTIFHKEYDSTNKLVKLFLRMNNDKSFLSKKYYYNSDGNLLKVETLDKGGWINYTESKKYDKISNSVTNYLENEDGVKEQDVYFYNTKNQIIKRENPADRSILIGRNATVEYDRFKYQDEYSYNPDGTLFEWKRMIRGTKTQMSRFRYFKKDIQ